MTLRQCLRSTRSHSRSFRWILCKPGDFTQVQRDLLIETQTGKPTPRQVHAQFLHQLPFAGDAVLHAVL